MMKDSVIEKLYDDVAEWFSISKDELVRRSVKGEQLFNQYYFRNCKDGEIPF